MKTKFTFFIEGLNREECAVDFTETKARKAIWLRLSDDDRNKVVIFDLIDEEVAA